MTVTEIEDGKFRYSCADCGHDFTLRKHAPFGHTCTDGTIKTYWPEGFSAPKREPGPSFTQKARNFVKAAVKHVACGRPQATDEQVAERFAVCQGCELFEDTGEGTGKCRHPSCGCALKKVGVKGMNKLRWADQSCPLEKWLPILQKSPPVPPKML